MNLLISRILTYLNGAFVYNEYYRFCYYLVNHYSDFEDIELDEVITYGISKESIIGFCNLLGFESFEQFKERLLQDHMLRIDQTRARLLGVDSSYLMERANNTFGYLYSEEQLDNLCDVLFKSKRIILLGAMYPMSIAIDFQTDFISFGKPVIQYNTFDPSLQFKEDDFILFISATGRSIRDFYSHNNIDSKTTNSLLVTQNKIYDLSQHRITTYTTLLPGKFDGCDFNHQLIIFFDILRIRYYQQYYL